MREMGPAAWLAILLAIACREPSRGAAPAGVTASASQANRAPELPEGMCSPESSQSCGEWCAEHGTLEADCVPCKARRGGK